ncbi:putative cytokinetic ring protein SteA [Nocardioides sp.]|uniref:putative cytokinetic ring protein SteA n=1 Tax=Nocardioides sp. TaxID=35761 RepID=UPI003569B384
MKLAARRTPPTLPGLVGTARVERRSRSLLPRLRPGDIAVVDHVDMDRSTAQALVDAGVSAVLNASPMISGRYANLGPELLAAAGVTLVDSLGARLLATVPDGQRIRVDGATVHVEGRPVARGRAVDARMVSDEMAAARTGLATQLETFTLNSAEFLGREQDLLLHGQGLPRPGTRIADRPVVVVVRGHDYEAELAAIRPFLREQHPVLIGVENGADVLLEAGYRPDIVVLDARADQQERPSAKVLRRASDVVVRVERDGNRAATDQLERLGVRPLRVDTAATSEDVALLLADAGEASVIVGVGMHATLDEFLDRQRSGLASTYLTRLKVGPRLVDASAVPQLYSGRVRPRHLLLVMLAGLLALAAALSVTPAGRMWGDALMTALTDLFDIVRTLP